MKSNQERSHCSAPLFFNSNWSGAVYMNSGYLLHRVYLLSTVWVHKNRHVWSAFTTLWSVILSLFLFFFFFCFCFAFNQPKRRIKMAAKSCTLLTRMLRRNQISRDRTHPFDSDIWWWTYFSKIHIQTRRHRDHNRQHWEGYCDAVFGPVPWIDTTFASQSCYMKVFASVDSFKDVYGE